jgi:hypothetical protein
MIPMPDWLSVIVEVVVPFNPVCCTVHVPVKFGGLANPVAIDAMARPKAQTTEIARRFILNPLFRVARSSKLY